MKILWPLLFSFFLSSCFFKDEIKLKERSGTNYVSLNREVIEQAKLIPWRVGKLRKQKITRGVRLKLNIPRFDKLSLKTLSRELNVDSWILKVSMKEGGSSVGSELFLIPLLRKSKLKETKTNSSLDPVDFTYVDIHYAASAISSDFARLACPKLGHNKVVKSFEVQSRGQSTQTLRVSKFSSKSAPGRVQEFNFQGNTVNGGDSLIGEYKLEMALYDSKKKSLRSNFIEFENFLAIKSESEVQIKGCP